MASGSIASVTVIIPAYNAAKFIERTVRSAIRQTYPNLEILVIDDGSTDETASIVEALTKQVPNLELITIPNGGVANARNVGTERSVADYVAYLDADDLWHPTKIEKQVNALDQHRKSSDWVACYTLFRRIDSFDNVISTGSSHAARGAFFGSHLVTNHVGNGSSLMVRRTIALELGGFDPSYAAANRGGCEDLDFQLKTLREHKLEVVPEFLVGYRSHPDNMSSQYRQMALGHIDVIRKYSKIPGVSNRLRRLALISSYRYAIAKLVRGKEWSSLNDTIWELFKLAPALTGILLLSKLFDLGVAPFRRVKHRLFSFGNVSTKRSFDDYLPTEGLLSEDRLPHRKQIERLKLLEKESSKSCFGVASE